MRALPKQFSSYIQMYDYLREKQPELLKAKSVIFLDKTMNSDSNVTTKTFRIRIDTLKRKCFDELNANRITYDEVVKLKYSLNNMNSSFTDHNLINKLANNSIKINY